MTNPKAHWRHIKTGQVITGEYSYGRRPKGEPFRFSVKLDSGEEFSIVPELTDDWSLNFGQYVELIHAQEI